MPLTQSTPEEGVAAEASVLCRLSLIPPHRKDTGVPRPWGNASPLHPTVALCLCPSGGPGGGGVHADYWKVPPLSLPVISFVVPFWHAWQAKKKHAHEQGLLANQGRRRPCRSTGVTRSQETAPPEDPTVGICLGPCGGPIPYVAKRWSHWHVSLGNSLWIRI